MGCWGSRDGQSKIISQRSDLYQFIDLLNTHQFKETVFIKSSLLSYSFSREDQRWNLIRRRTLFTFNSLMTLIQEDKEDQAPNMDIEIANEPFILRPIQDTYPRQKILQLESTCSLLYGISNRIMTCLQIGDIFPKDILADSLFNQQQLMQLGSNGKFTFIASWSNYGHKSLHRFLQLYKHRWSKFIPENQREVFCVCQASDQSQKQLFEEEAKKMKWDNYTHIFIHPQHKGDNDFFTAGQVLNIPDRFNQREADIFVIVGPQGQVLRAERPNFVINCITSAQPEQPSGNNSQISDNDELQKTQYSHSILYEKALEKEIKKIYGFVGKQPPAPQLSQRSLQLHSLLSEKKAINKAQFEEVKSFFMSIELEQYLNANFIGERFTFEAEKWVIYDVDRIVKSNIELYQESSRLYQPPAVYSTSSHRKEGLMSQIFQFLRDNIPLKWTIPPNFNCNQLRQYTVNKEFLIEDLQDQLKEIEMVNLELYLQVNRKFEWVKQSKVDFDALEQFQTNQLKSKILDEKDVVKTWVPVSQIKNSSIQFHSKIIKIDNIPVGPEAYSNYSGMIKYAQDAYEARNDPDNASVSFQELDPIVFQLITDFYMQSISTEIKLNSQYTPIPQCVRLGEGKPIDIEFEVGRAMCIFLMDWENEVLLANLRDLYDQLKIHLVTNIQAQSGKQIEALNVRLVILGYKSNVPVELVEKGLQMIAPESPESIEIWYPHQDYYGDCEDYIYQGLLCKFFGLDVNAENILLYDSDGYMLFRGNTSSINVEECLQRGARIQQDSYFFESHSSDDSQWRTMKKYFRKNRNQIANLMGKVHSISRDGAYFRVESTKYKVWDNKKHIFIDFCTPPILTYSLEEDSKQLLSEVIEAFSDLF